MTIRKSKKEPTRKTKKEPIISTVEMEVAIAKMFGIRTNIIVPNLSWGLSGMHECDLFLIKKSGVGVEIEIKRSKSDFLADFKKGHNHVDRFNRITEFYYAFPEQLIGKCIDLIPPDAGIISCQRHDYGQKNVYATIERKPKRIKGARKLTEEEQLKVARLGVMRIWSLKEKIIKNGKTKI